MLTILEGALAEFSSFLLELLDGSLIDTTTLVNQMSSSGGLAGIDMANDCNQSDYSQISSDRKKI